MLCNKYNSTTLLKRARPVFNIFNSEKRSFTLRQFVNCRRISIGSTVENISNLENLETEFNDICYNVFWWSLCERVMNNTFLQQSYATLKLKSEDDLRHAQRDTPPYLTYSSGRLYKNSENQKVEDRSLSPFTDYIDFKQNRWENGAFSHVLFFIECRPEISNSCTKVDRKV